MSAISRVLIHERNIKGVNIKDAPPAGSRLHPLLGIFKLVETDSLRPPFTGGISESSLSGRPRPAGPPGDS
jgi:hypothetical protein